MSKFRLGDNVQHKDYADLFGEVILIENGYVTYKNPTTGIWVYSEDTVILSQQPAILNKTLSGVKHDGGKPDLSLLPRAGKEEIAKAFMVGEKKYGRYNFKGGMEWTRLLSAAERHLTAFTDGENLDPETGLVHLGHAGACIMMLLDYYTNQLGTDNRFNVDKK